MVSDFVRKYITKIVDCPNLVSVDSKKLDSNLCELKIMVADEDIGRVIGKNGKMVSAIKTVISACKAKDQIGYKITVETCGSGVNRA